MGRIIDVEEVQRELNRAARDATRGPRDVRAGRFVHANARGDETTAKSQRRTSPSKAGPPRNRKGAR